MSEYNQKGFLGSFGLLLAPLGISGVLGGVRVVVLVLLNELGNNVPAGCDRHSSSELRGGLPAAGDRPQCEGRPDKEVQLQAGHESGLLQQHGLSISPRYLNSLYEILPQIYDLDDSTEYREVRRSVSSTKNNRYENPVNVRDDEEEVFEKDDFEDYNQTVRNFLMNSREEQEVVAGWPRDPLGRRESVSSLDLEEYR